jgi:hypothetical protein
VKSSSAASASDVGHRAAATAAAADCSPRPRPRARSRPNSLTRLRQRPSTGQRPSAWNGALPPRQPRLVLRLRRRRGRVRVGRVEPRA